jgi:hypothetical protein
MADKSKDNRCYAFHTAFTLLQATKDLPSIVQMIEDAVKVGFEQLEKLKDNVKIYTWRASEETYEIILVFKERLGFQKRHQSLLKFATDAVASKATIAFARIEDVKRAVNDAQCKVLKAGLMPNILAAAPPVGSDQFKQWPGCILMVCIAAYGPQHEGINKAPGIEGEYEYAEHLCRENPLTYTLEQYGSSLIKLLSAQDGVNDVAVLSKRQTGFDSTAEFYTFVQLDEPTSAKWRSLAKIIEANPLMQNGAWFTHVAPLVQEGAINQPSQWCSRVVKKDTQDRVDFPPVPNLKLELGLKAEALVHRFAENERKLGNP